jgi:hypothetical protein
MTTSTTLAEKSKQAEAEMLAAMIANATKHDWPEDFPHENGRYTSICCVCGVQFLGHKRRAACRYHGSVK